MSQPHDCSSVFMESKQRKATIKTQSKQNILISLRITLLIGCAVETVNCNWSAFHKPSNAQPKQQPLSNQQLKPARRLRSQAS